VSLPPGPRARYPGQFALALSRNRIPFLERVARDYGDVAHFRVGGEQLFLVNHPDLIRDILVTHQRSFHKGRGLERAKALIGDGLLTSEGDFHLRQRRLAQPAFHRDRIATYGAAMTELAARRQAGWRSGAELDVHAEMMALTLAIVGKTLFGADIESESAEIGEAITTAFEAFNVTFYLPLGELLERLPIPPTLRFRRARERLDATIYRLIDERRRSGADRADDRGHEQGDLLSMLMRARDDEGDGGHMTDAQLRDEALTIFLAGHETTANALTWTWYLLSTHPEVERRVHEEVDALGGRRPAVDDLPRLAYTRMVLAESMRLYPPAWIVGRRALVPYAIREFTIPARGIVLMSQYLMHRDARYFPEPTRFDPERWRPERIAERPRFAYFPFGGGTRICIGEQFAWMEGVLLLATIAQQWRFTLSPAQRIAVQPIITLRPKYGMRMIARGR
jgi:cytochrome P450